jgi:hypothetical protein
LEVLPHVNELRDKEDKVSHMSFRFNESASATAGTPRVTSWAVGSVTITGKNGTSSESVFTGAFGCFATGSSKVKRGVWSYT